MIQQPPHTHCSHQSSSRTCTWFTTAAHSPALTVIIISKADISTSPALSVICWLNHQHKSCAISWYGQLIPMIALCLGVHRCAHRTTLPLLNPKPYIWDQCQWLSSVCVCVCVAHRWPFWTLNPGTRVNGTSFCLFWTLNPGTSVCGTSLPPLNPKPRDQGEWHILAPATLPWWLHHIHDTWLITTNDYSHVLMCHVATWGFS